MAIGDNYATLNELKSYMGNDLTGADTQLTDALASASREIERYCGRQFNDSGAATARVYRPINSRTVFVHDFHTAAGFVLKTMTADDGIYDLTWQSEEYELRPLNGVNQEGTPWVYYEVCAVDWVTFPDGYRPSVQVTARWGWSSVPTLVHQACLELAASTYALRHARLGVAGSDQFGSIIRVQDNKMAKEKLKHYRRGSVTLG